MKRLLTIIIISLMFSQANAQLISIAAARALPVGDTITITGIVTNGSELGVIRYIQDATAGIALYDSNMPNTSRGDSITITGVTVLWSDLLEVQPIISTTIHSSNHPTPTPVILTPAQMDATNIAELAEFQNVTITGAGGTFSGNTNYTFTNGTESGQLRISTTSSLVGQLIPIGLLNITGICSQYYTNYQLLLRDSNDIQPQSSISLTTPLTVNSFGLDSISFEWGTDANSSSELFYGNHPDSLNNHFSAGGSSTQHLATISGLSPSQLVYAKAFSVGGSDTAYSAVRAAITQSQSSGDMKVYFSTDVDTSVSTGTYAVYLDDAIDDTLIAYIDRAQESIDFTIYNFNNSGISDISTAINNAYNRGVDIRFIHDGDANNFGANTINSNINIIASPIAYTYPSDTGIMHNKFVVIDAFSADPNAPIVWTGATNWTDGQINLDANSVIIVQDKSLAITYVAEFEEMWGSNTLVPNTTNSKWGPSKTDNTPHDFLIGGKQVECFFSPSDNVNAKIIETIQSADVDIYVETMLITRSDIGYAIRDEVNAGAIGKVIVNAEGDCSPTVVNTLAYALGNDFRQHGESGILHSKTLIVDQNSTNDDPLVLTGSHNWSNSADYRNDENTLIIHDASIANQYYQHFVARFNLGSIIGLPVVNLGGDFTMCAGDSINLNAGTGMDAYLWSTGETTQTIWVDTNGVGVGSHSYWVEVTNNGNTASDTLVITWQICPGFEDFTQIQSFNIYPNPTEDLLNINFQSTENGNGNIRLSNIQGQEVYSKYIEWNVGNNMINIDLNIEPGIYILTMETKSGMISRKLSVR